MVRVRPFPALPALLICTGALIGPARAQTGGPPGAVGTMPLPGGVTAALEAIEDPVTPDRAHFMVEAIRRWHDMPAGARAPARSGGKDLLVAHVRAAAASGTAPAHGDTVPLPLPAPVWIETIFGGDTSEATLAARILDSRNASLLYLGLLALDDGTRAWIAGERALLADLHARHPAAFLAAAPALRVSGGEIALPGGHLAAPVWEALVGRPGTGPADFVRALVAQHEGRLAWFAGAMAQLPPERLHIVLGLGQAVDARIDAGRRLLHIFASLSAGWRIEQRAFWRPSLDPALLAADLDLDAEGRLILPGTRAFWRAAFEDDEPRPGDDEAFAAGLIAGPPVDFAWLCEQLFTGSHAIHRHPYHQVLFASRRLGPVTAANARTSLEVVRAAARYPALVGALERAGLRDLDVYAAAARRAASIAGVGNRGRAERALGQFQGALFLITRAAVRGGLDADGLARAVSALAAVEVSPGHGYDGRAVRWLAAFVRAEPGASTSGAPDEVLADAGGNLEAGAIRLMAGGTTDDRFADWEGTRYVVDFPGAERLRLVRMLGPRWRPSLSAAVALVRAADTLEAPDLDDRTLAAVRAEIEELAGRAAWERETMRAFERAAGDVPRRRAAGRAAELRALADELLGRGLIDLAYAAAMGHPERARIPARDAANRHDFGLHVAGHGAAWWMPVAGADRVRDWHVRGSLLGMDVRLAELSLQRLSLMPPVRRPSLNDIDRRTFIEATALPAPPALSDATRDRLLEAMRAGRSRLVAARTRDAAEAIAEDLRLGAIRRTLLSWTTVHDPDRAGAFLGPSELLGLGLAGPADSSVHAYGSTSEPRTGCLCLRVDLRRPAEMLAGRWDSGIFASGFADLSLRLAELLAELRMPASLLAPVLAAAMLDFVNTVSSRDADDRRGLLDFVQNLRVERAEQYLGLLTTDGPLVPLEESGAPAPGSRTANTPGGRP